MEDRKSASHRNEGPLIDALLDDIQGFEDVDRALSLVSFSDEEKFNIYSRVAAVLHLGNIEFKNTRDGFSDVVQESEHSLNTASELLKIERGQLKKALVSKALISKAFHTIK